MPTGSITIAFGGTVAVNVPHVGPATDPTITVNLGGSTNVVLPLSTANATISENFGFDAEVTLEVSDVEGSVDVEFGGVAAVTILPTAVADISANLGGSFQVVLPSSSSWSIDIENTVNPTSLVFPDLAFQISNAPPLATPNWIGIDGALIGFTAFHGKGSELDDIAPGTGTVILDNNAASFDPDNNSSPYAALLTTTRRVRVTATWADVVYVRLDGYVDLWPMDDDPTFEGGRQVTVPVTDALGLLANRDIAPGKPFTLDDPVLGLLDAGNIISGDPDFPQTLSGLRISDILDLIDFPDAMRNIDTGLSLLVEDKPTDKVLPVLQQVARSEMGLLYATAGTVVFRQRNSADRSVLATFTDNPAEQDGLPYEDIDIDPGSSALIKNRVTRATHLEEPAARTYTANDTDSQQTFGIIEDSQTDLLNADYADIVGQANYVIARYGDGVKRIISLTVSPIPDPDNLWPVILGADLLNMLAVGRTPQIGGPIVMRDCTIESVSDAVAAPSSWSTTWQLIESDPTPYFTLDDELLGLLDAGNIIAY